MKKNIHPNYVECTVRCTCGNIFHTRSTQPEIVIDLCDKCHPFYTGTQKLVDTGGRVQRFADKFGGAAKAQMEAEKARRAQKQKQAEELSAAKKAATEAKAAKKAQRAAEFAKKAPVETEVAQPEAEQETTEAK